MSDPKKASEKIFDIPGLLVADPFRRWLIVGYIIFNPDLFILIFTSKQKFEIFQQYFKLNYCPWSSVIGEYFSLRIHAIYQFLSWPLHHIIFPFLFSCFWCFVYPRFEIWHRERMKENQDKIKDIKDNNILQTQINELEKQLQTKQGELDNANFNQIYCHSIFGMFVEHMTPCINEALNNNKDIDISKFTIVNNARINTDRYENAITEDQLKIIKTTFNFKGHKLLFIDNNPEHWEEDKCIDFLKIISITLNPDRKQLSHLFGKKCAHSEFTIRVMYRLYQLKNTPNDKI